MHTHTAIIDRILLWFPRRVYISLILSVTFLDVKNTMGSQNSWLHASGFQIGCPSLLEDVTVLDSVLFILFLVLKPAGAKDNCIPPPNILSHNLYFMGASPQTPRPRCARKVNTSFTISLSDFPRPHGALRGKGDYMADDNDR